MEADRDILLKAFLKITLDTVHNIYQTLKNEGKITKQLEADYLEYTETVHTIFEQDPENFSMNSVFFKLPKNTWIPTYMDHIAKENKNKPKPKGRTSLYGNPIFEKILKDIKKAPKDLD